MVQCLKKGCNYADKHFGNNYGIIGSVGTLCTALIYGDIEKLKYFPHTYRDFDITSDSSSPPETASIEYLSLNSVQCKDDPEPQTRKLPFTYFTDYSNGRKIDIFTNNEVGAIKIKEINEIAVETEGNVLEIKIPTPEYMAGMTIYAFTPKRFHKILPFIRYVNKVEVEEITSMTFEKTLSLLEKVHVQNPAEFASPEEYAGYFQKKLNWLKYSLPKRFKKENEREIKIVKEILDTMLETTTQV